MRKIDRWHKLGFTGLMKNDRHGEWCCWEDVKDIIKEDNISESLVKEYIGYKSRCRLRFNVLLTINTLVFGLLLWA